ncbi:hypothetical protein AHAS_Ahas04G0194500 [Arachis hypogaea]
MASANTPSETPSSQEQGSTPDASIGTQKNNNRAKTDPAWGHCKQVVESGKTILLCIYCEKLIRGGGIHRFKLHLAGKGGDIESCRKVPAAVRHQFHESIEELRSKKRKTQEQYAESYNACDDVEREFDEIERNEMQQQQKSRVPTPISRKGKQVKAKKFVDQVLDSKEFTSSAYSKEAKAKKFVDQVLDSKFWSQCTDIVKLTSPLVHVLRIVDSEDRPAMGYLYQAIYKAREEMVRRFQKRKKVVDPYLKILDTRWDAQLKRNLHAAGYWLNPAFRFNAGEFENHKETISGLLDVIEKYAYDDPVLNSKLTSEKRIFKNAEKDFGRPSAIRERTTVMPDQWWESYGCGAPNLQKLAIRVLSQTCSSSGCERNWSIFEHIHSKKRNRLEHQKLNDLVYVHYNLRLQQRNQMRNQVYDPICLDAFEDHSEWILEDSPPFLTLEEIDALRNDLANMSLQSPLDDLDQLDLEDDREDDGANNSVENANQNETNQDVAPHLSDEEQLADFEITPWI